MNDKNNDRKILGSLKDQLSSPVDTIMWSKKFRFTVSVLAAIVIWFFVVETENPTIKVTVADVPVVVHGADSLSEGGLMPLTAENYTVKVVVEGRRSDLIGIRKESIKASADISWCTEGINEVPVRAEFSGSGRITSVYPMNFDIKAEKKVTELKPVVIEYTGRMADDMVAVSAVSDPESVEVTGPESEVASVRNAKAVINSAELSAGENMLKVLPEIIGIPVPNQEGSLQNTLSHLEPVSEITVKVEVWSKKTVPLVVPTSGKLADGYEIEGLTCPKNAVIQGPEEILKDVSVINCEPVYIGGRWATFNQDLSLLLPEGTSLSSGNENMSVRVRIREKSQAEHSDNSSNTDGDENSGDDASVPVQPASEQKEETTGNESEQSSEEGEKENSGGTEENDNGGN